MNFRSLCLILLVVAIWGFNFVFIRLGLNGMPPLLLCTIRFFFAAIPAVFFLPRPKCSWKLLISYGVIMFGLQFSFLFSGMQVGMSPGLASLLMQFQVFFTMGLAAWILRETPRIWKIVGAGISFVGIFWIARHTQADVTPLGIALTLIGSLCWAAGNVISKQIGKVPPLSLVTWGSLMAVPFVLFLSLSFEGYDKIRDSLFEITWVSVLAVGYIVYFSTYIAYSLWSHLLNHHSTASIVPFTLLVPVFGILGSVIFLAEELPQWKAIGAAFVIAGLCFNLLEPLYEKYVPRQKQTN